MENYHFDEKEFDYEPEEGDPSASFIVAVVILISFVVFLGLIVWRMLP